MNQSEDNDVVLITRFKQGANEVKQSVFRTLVNKHSEQLYWQIRRLTKNHELTDDVLQLVWMKVWQNLADFELKSTFYTWAYRIARNETLNYLQKEKRNDVLSLDGCLLELIPGQQNGQEVSAEQMSSWLLDAIEHLPEKQALVFQLKYFEDLPYQDIAEKTGTSVGALKANYHHAKQKIEEFLLQRLNH